MATFSCKFKDCRNQNFSSLEQAADHINSNHSHGRRLFPKSCVVTNCGHTSFRLIKHYKKSHRNLCEYSCNVCSRVFVRDRDLQRHKKDVRHPQGGITFNYQPEVSVTERCKTVGTTREGRFEAQTGTVNFSTPVTVSDLNRFIANKLQPTIAFNQKMNRTVKQICDFLQRHLEPNSIVKGGSLGKGTAIANNGMADIDLVLVLNCVEDARDLKEKLPNINKNIKELLQGNAPKDFTIVPGGNVSDKHFLVKFTVKLDEHETVDVDLLPTFSFPDGHRQQLYEKMKHDEPHLEYYSASLVKQQVSFLEEYPANVKNLIRLVKYWKKEKVSAEGSLPIPNSYVMELITIHIWETKQPNNGNFNTLKAFHGVMKALENYQSLNAIWWGNYTKDMIPKEIQKERPLVLDPANPMNNVCSSFGWDEISTAAKEVLASPMMRGVTSNSWN